MDYKIVRKDVLYQGFFRFEGFTVEHDTFKGGVLTIERELLERGDAVAILLYDKQYDEVLLIEQFRMGPAARAENAWMIEVVAGMLDADEDKVQCAIRESIEEAGYEPLDIQFLGKTYTSPGGTSECLYMYLGYVDKHKPVSEGGGLDVEHEDIRSFWVSRKEALQMVQDGRINSSVPMLTIMLAFGIRGVVSAE